MIAIVDYGVGNLFSIASALNFLGLDNEVVAEEARLRRADKIILPGVGAFHDAAMKLRASGLWNAVREEALAGKPLLGICLGMQLLFERSYEYGTHAGLGLIAGDICPLAEDLPEKLKVPHIGWNSLDIKTNDPLFASVPDDSFVYYVHSYYAKHCADAILATSRYGVDVPGVVRRANIYGTQFHPEKSAETGLRLLRAFAETKGACVA